MKKLMVIAVMAAAGFTASSQAASTGTITFNGEVTATTCDANVDGQGADATINLSTVGANQLAVRGDTAMRTGFIIGLSNCQGTLQTASAFFQAGSTVDPLTGRLKNTGGDAQNVSLQLRENTADENVIVAGDASQSTGATFYDVSSGSADLPYTVEYYAEDPATAGTVTSSVVYSIQYK